MSAPSASDPGAVAIVAVAGRFPGAPTIEAFWQNLCTGTESIRRYSDAELEALGVEPALRAHPKFVPAGALLDGIDRFDAALFGFSRREAEVLDPQHRLFFECVWEALERAGYAPGLVREPIGLFAGTSLSTYLIYNLIPEGQAIRDVGVHQIYIANDKDSLTTHVSYKLNLRGPSVTVQTACSTSLVAVQFACQSLLGYQCDIAVAGGVSIQVPHLPGYVYQEGGIASPDGHCRAFDASAAGTVSGNGVGAVVLKRLEDAVADRDTIVAVIRGAAINNDGSAKVGYTAPGADGQAEVVALAQGLAGITPETIGYVEAHGTGTPLGDPVELAALTRVFAAHTPRTQFCAIGSVKTNIGHLDAAAGVAGLIKAALAVQQGIIPPSLHYERPNANARLADGPFFVPTRAMPWPIDGPRRAAVSSFGIGGTNAHVVLEQAPAAPPALSSTRAHILTLSARSAGALDRLTRDTADRLAGDDSLSLADAAFTLQVGRRTWPHRRAFVATTKREAVDAIRNKQSAISNPQYSAETALAQRWLRGEEIDWVAYHAGEPRRRVPMPVTPFERQRYWIDPPSAAAATRDIGEWLYLPQWSPAPLPPPGNAVAPRRILVVGGAPAIADRLVTRLTNGGHNVSPVSLDSLSQVVNTRSSTDPALVVIYAGALDGGNDPDGDQGRRRAFDEPLTIARALADVPAATLLLLSSDPIPPILPIPPVQALMMGPALVVPQEYPHLRCRMILVDMEAGGDWSETIASELDGDEPLVALRGGARMTRHFVRDDAGPTGASRFERGGVYWITGASGGIGGALASHLAHRFGARLLLTSRTALAPDAIAALETAGAEILSLAVDVTDAEGMRAAAAAAVARFGRIDGIIHAAGVPGGGVIALKSSAAAAAVLAPKVAGTLILAAIARDQRVRFLALCSSLASLQGGFGQVDYVAANAFLDAFAAWHTRDSGIFTVSIGWDAWRETGMAVAVTAALQARAAGSGAAPSTAMLPHGLLTREGVAAFDRILAGSAPQVAVSTIELNARIAGLRDGTRTMTTLAAGRPEGLRPDGFAGLSVDAEIAALWRGVLGDDAAGRENFFDEGGDSLTGVQLVARVNERFHLDIPVARFFGAPTAASLAALVRAAAAPAADAPGDAPSDPSLDPSRERGRRRADRRRGRVAV